jgi:hypothetical protein
MDVAMITAEEAHALAQKEIDGLIASQDPLFLPWVDGRVSEPILVSDVFGRPSYWLVPFISDGHAVGFARVSAAGRVFAAGVFCQDPKRLSRCPKVGTGITSNEAFQLASEKIDASAEVAEAPIFVHDGPAGREAWLVQVLQSGQAHRWLFVTKAGVYERPAGEVLDDSIEA